MPVRETTTPEWAAVPDRVGGSRMEGAARRIGAAVVVFGVVATGVAGAQTVADAEEGTDVEIQVDENGDSVWTVTTTVRLESDDEVQAFEEMDSQAAAEETVSRFRRFANRAENQTGREMSVELTSSEKEHENGVGIVIVGLDCDGFGTVDEEGDGVYIDDFFKGGLSLEEGQTVRIQGPEGYAVGASNVSEAEVNDTSVRWDGLVEVEKDVSVVFEKTRRTRRRAAKVYPALPS
jgi:hypothetical protein